MRNLQVIIKKLNQLSYLLHLKQFSIPSNNNFSSVDLERILAVVHQYIEQLLAQEIEQEQLSLQEINQLFQVRIVDEQIIMTDAKYYLELLDEELNSVLNEYKQAIHHYQQNNSEPILGVLYNQIQRFKLLVDEFKTKKETYPDCFTGKQRILKRRNEPFDSEAILDDLL